MVNTPFPPPPHWAIWDDAVELTATPAVTPADRVLGEIQKYYSYKGEDPMKKKSLTNGLVLTHTNFTKGGKALALALDAARVVKQDLLPVLRADRTIFAVTNDTWGIAAKYELLKTASVPFLINWGCANPVRSNLFKDVPTGLFKKVLNDPKAVSTATNKSAFFNLMTKASDAPRIPEFTTELDVAQKWVDDGLVVIGRMNHGSSGRDVAFYNEAPDKFLGSDLWVQYKKKKHEYRLHFMNGGIFLVQQKVLPKTDPEGNAIPKDNVDFRIRTHRTGFIFQKFDVRVPEDVQTQALKAAKASGLDFGAIDVIYNAHENKAYVLEINTAPGLEGTTVDTYKAEFQKLLAA